MGQKFSNVLTVKRLAAYVSLRSVCSFKYLMCHDQNQVGYDEGFLWPWLEQRDLSLLGSLLPSTDIL